MPVVRSAPPTPRGFPTRCCSPGLLCVPGLFLRHQTAFFFCLSGDLNGYWFSLRLFPSLKYTSGGWGQRGGCRARTESRFKAYAANFSAPTARTTQTLTIERRGVEIEEGGIKVKLTLVDTPGFGDSVDCSDW